MKQHANKFLSLVAETKKRIKEITPHLLQKKLDDGESFAIIDIREDNEWCTTPHIPSAMHISKGLIERDVEKQFPDVNTPIVVYCSGGYRSVLVADNLQQMGYKNVFSLEAGLSGWVNNGFTVVAE